MLSTAFILKHPKLEKSQDYAALRSLGIEHVENLAKKIWTDYNIHDPGITLLEMLCYAITDLGYRTSFDIKDLLTESAGDSPFIADSAFHTARAIFPNYPVSFTDLRKILIDIQGVKQAWININLNVYYYLDRVNEKLIYKNLPDDSAELCDPLNGLYDVLIQFEDFVAVDPVKVVLGIRTESLQDFRPGDFINPNPPGARKIFPFTVEHPLILKSVVVIPEVAGVVQVRLMKDDDLTPLYETTFLPVRAQEPRLISLEWDIGISGNYHLDTGSTTIKLHRATNVEFPIEIRDVIQIVREGSGSAYRGSYYFFYDWKIEYRSLPKYNSDGSINPGKSLAPEEVMASVKNRLYAYRNLCEDFIHVRGLKEEAIGICMDLEVAPDADLEEVLAEIYYQLEIYISPPVNFYTIEELVERGKTTDQIFEGPLLDHGFIDNDEFSNVDRRTCLRTSDIIQIIMDVPKVLAVKSISLLSFWPIEISDVTDDDIRITDETGTVRYFRVREEGPWVLRLLDSSEHAPDFVPQLSKTYFYKNNLPYLANRKEVLQLLSEKRVRNIRAKLKGHESDLPFPTGKYRNLEDYYPIQNDMPETYFVGQNLVPDSRSKMRKAQSRQLKGFLLFFEQILANYLSQLAHVKDLFTWDKDALPKTYFTQKLKEIAHIEELYIKDYETEVDGILEDIIESDLDAARRKNKFLDHLIGRFSEELTEYGLMMYSLLKEDSHERLMIDKQAFLGDYPRLSSERGKAFDYRKPEVYDNLTGFQRRIYRLLGIYDTKCKVGRKSFANERVIILEKVCDEDPEVTLYFFRILSSDEDPNDHSVEDVDKNYIYQSNCCGSRSQICVLIDRLISFGSKEENWCKVNGNIFDEESPNVLKRNCVSCDDLITWVDEENFSKAEEEILGYTHSTDDDSHSAALDQVISLFQQLNKCEGFHLIENILLRKRTVESDGDFLPVEIHSDHEECQCIEVKDPYSFRASIILPSWPQRFRSTRFRQFIEKTLRQEAPAHIYLRICWISHCEMLEFEECHDKWLKAHANLDCEYRGYRPLPELADMIDGSDEKTTLAAYREILRVFIEKLYSLNNVFTVARIHGCEDVDSEEPQISLGHTSLGSI